jgi:hypothetical protein
MRIAEAGEFDLRDHRPKSKFENPHSKIFPLHRAASPRAISGFSAP